MTTRSMFNPLKRAALNAALCAALVLAGAPGLHVRAQSSPPAAGQAARAIEVIAAALAEGRRETSATLTTLGFGAAVAETEWLNGTAVHNLSPQSLLEQLYRRAEARSPGEGRRFLAVVHDHAAQESAALATDPSFAWLRNYPREVLLQPILFGPASPLSRVVAPLSPAAGRAIGLLGDHLAGPGFAAARGAILRNFKNPKFDDRAFETALAESGTGQEALKRIVALGTPPPSPELALRNTMRETMAASAALSVDPKARQAVDDLSSSLPERLERLTRMENTLDSRRRQADQISSTTPVGGGGGGGTGGENYRRYVERTFNGPGARAPRTYSRAIRMAGVARGVAIGGSVSSSITAKPVRVAWLPNRVDSRFGRFLIQMSDPAGGPLFLAASRVLVADSVKAAASVLWEQQHPQATYRPGELLILMSMDPDAALATTARTALEISA